MDPLAEICAALAVGQDVANPAIFTGFACIALLGAGAATGIALYERNQSVGELG